MRALALLTVLAIMLAGCSDKSDDDLPEPQDQTPIPPNDDPAETTYETVTLEESSFSAEAGAKCQPTLPTAPPVPTEDLIHEVLIPEGTKSLQATFTDTGQPQTLSPPTIKMYNPDQAVGGPAESEKRWSGGTITFTVNEPAKGLWSFTLYHCDVPATGSHSLDTLITAELPQK